MRLGWLAIVLLDMTLFVASLAVRWQELSNPSVGLRANLTQASLSPGFYAGYNMALEVVPALVFLTVALIIFLRKSDDPVGIFISLMLAMFGMAARPVVPTMEALIVAHPDFTPLVRLVTYLNWVAVFAFFCIFPDGRFYPRWTRYYLAFAALISIPWNFFPDSALSPWTWPPVLFVPFEIGIWGAGIYARFQRYRHYSNKRQREQTRWVLFGMTLSVVGVITFLVPRYIDPTLSDPGNPTAFGYQLISPAMIYLFALCTPVALTISILRYRLWNIDLIISRTLVYIPLTAVLAGAYTAAITLFQKIFMAATGEESDAAIVVTTLIVASLFTPIKNKLQTVVDKRFKESHDPISELAAFSKQVESVLDVIDAEQLTCKLLQEAVTAMGAEGGAVYLGGHGHMRLMHSWDNWDGEESIEVPLYRKGERSGLVVLGPRRDGKDYSEEDRKTLQEVVDSVAQAVNLSRAARVHEKQSS